MEDRLNKLEMLYSDQSKMIEEMSGEMFQQQQDLSRLKRQIEELKEKLDVSSHEIGGHERPPHY